MRMTKNRKIVLNLLKQAKKPLSAEDIANELIKDKIDLSTIYRSLDYFDDNNLLLRFHFNNKSYYILNSSNHHHYFVCTNCLSMHEIECYLKDTLEALKTKNNFTVTNHEINIYGLCDICSNL
ncbi:MAG TPA: transcriptional repressor [Acholeplasmataceae bacterium]|nr:transcriptional repressor [Acholeplasmataceae bacterium]